MKKLISLVLALALIALCAVASAATITINRKSDDTYTEETTYTYYRVLEAEIGTPGTVDAATGESTGGIAAYYVTKAALQTALVAAGANNVFKITAVANTDPVRYNYELKDGKTISDILPVVTDAGVLAAAAVTGTFTRAADANTAVSPELDPGYYVIKSSLGSVIAAQTLNDVTINEKNTYVELEKDVNDIIFEYGEDPEYTLKIKIPANPADKDLVVYDHMAKSLILDPAITVTGTKTGAEITGLTFSKDTYTDPQDEAYNYYQTVIPKASVIANAGQTITLTYTAKVSPDAVVYDWQNNKAHVEYDDHSFATPEDQEKVKSLGFKVIKVDGTDTTKVLTGAEFSLWSALTEGTQIPIIKVADGKYRVATPAEAAAANFESAPIVAGEADIDGLDNKTYYLQEDKAPEGGYNKLTARVAVTPDEDERIEYKVENNQGTELPSTGGIGTTIFYILGGLLVIGAAVILVARRKAHE